MEIRAITLFCEPGFTPEQAAPFLAAARYAFPYPVQSLRLALPPFPDWLVAPQAVTQAQTLAQAWTAVGVQYLSLGPVQLHHEATWLALVPTLLAASDRLFAAVEVADTAGNLDTGRCWQTAKLMRQVSTILANGFGNLYLAALAHCAPGSPFFPVAYHRGGAPTFALAIESADLALQAMQAAHSLEEARQNLITAVAQAANAIEETAVALSAQFAIPFHGLDFSLAPYPTDDKSLGGALEALGLPHIGAAGSLFAAGFITEALERAQFRRCGFSGLMLPVLEDAVLARRAAAGLLTLQDLLSYSAVCGVGLDTIPLPGEISEDALTAVLLDIAMLASRLRKPLTARLMPLPGLVAGDAVHFDFPYFANSRVMAPVGGTLNGLLRQPARLPMKQVHK